MFYDAKTLGIRDVKDAREASDKFAAIRRMAKAGKFPQVGGPGRGRYPRTGAQAPGSSAGSTLSAAGRQGGTGLSCGGSPLSNSSGRVDDSRCFDDNLCHASILGFNTLEGDTSDFPLAGGAGTVAEGSLIVSSGNAGSYRGTHLFWEGRDSAAGYAVVPTLLTSAVISGSEQLVGSGGEFGITSAVFALTCEPLPINWCAWQDSGQQRLTMRFGNFLDIAVETEIFGVFWGDRVPS